MNYLIFYFSILFILNNSKGMSLTTDKVKWSQEVNNEFLIYKREIHDNMTIGIYNFYKKVHNLKVRAK